MPPSLVNDVAHLYLTDSCVTGNDVVDLLVAWPSLKTLSPDWRYPGGDASRRYESIGAALRSHGTLFTNIRLNSHDPLHDNQVATLLSSLTT